MKPAAGKPTIFSGGMIAAFEEYSTAGLAGINACGDGTSTFRETCSRVLSKNPVTGRKQEIAMFEKPSGESEVHDFSRG